MSDIIQKKTRKIVSSHVAASVGLVTELWLGSSWDASLGLSEGCSHQVDHNVSEAPPLILQLECNRSCSRRSAQTTDITHNGAQVQCLSA